MINKHVLIFVGFSQPYVWPPLYLLVPFSTFTTLRVLYSTILGEI